MEKATRASQPPSGFHQKETNEEKLKRRSREMELKKAK